MVHRNGSKWIGDGCGRTVMWVRCQGFFTKTIYAKLTFQESKHSKPVTNAPHHSPLGLHEQLVAKFPPTNSKWQGIPGFGIEWHLIMISHLRLRRYIISIYDIIIVIVLKIAPIKIPYQKNNQGILPGNFWLLEWRLGMIHLVSTGKCNKVFVCFVIAAGMRQVQSIPTADRASSWKLFSNQIGFNSHFQNPTKNKTGRNIFTVSLLRFHATFHSTWYESLQIICHCEVK